MHFVPAHSHIPARRRLLCAAAAFAAAGGATPTRAAAPAPRRLALVNTHTGERLDALYFDDGRYVPDALAAIDHVLRDHRTGEAHPIDPALLDLLTGLRARLATAQPYHVISGYRAPATNAMLADASGGVARASLHLEGRAIDVRVPGTPLGALQRAALAARGGGVGLYPRSDFVHLDTGRVRAW